MAEIKENSINPRKVEDLIKELTSPNISDLEKFSEAFPEEILEFSEIFSKTYIKYIELERIVERSSNDTQGVSQENCVLFFTLQFIQNLFSSTKLLLSGYQLASGNLLRQVIEGMAITILCSLKCNIKRKVNNKKFIEFNYYRDFKADKEYARSHKAVSLLSINKDISGVTEYGEQIIKLFKDHGNQYSHPNFRNTLLLIPKESFGNKMFFGNYFDPERIQDYKDELFIRIILCEKLPDLIDKLSNNIKLI
ncbi:MAG: hypothetical protein WC799_23170 [Desulfobacteraceae bacterium]|jgi:hypothetical protein